MVDDKLEAKLADLGASRNEIGDNTDNNRLLLTMCGSPLYCAPEVVTGGQYNSKVDCYSFGIMLFQVLCCSIPTLSPEHIVAQAQKVQSIMAVVSGWRPSWPKLERLDLGSTKFDRASALVKSLWDGEPERRPTMANVVVQLEKMKPKPKVAPGAEVIDKAGTKRQQRQRAKNERSKCARIDALIKSEREAGFSREAFRLRRFGAGKYVTC